MFHYVSHLPNHSTTFSSLSSQVVHWSAEIQAKVSDPRKEGRSDRLIDQASKFAFAHLTPISNSTKYSSKHQTEQNSFPGSFILPGAREGREDERPWERGLHRAEQNSVTLQWTSPRFSNTLDSPLNNPVLRLKAMTRLGPRVNSITSVAGGISCTSAFVWRRSHESEQLAELGSQISSATQAKQTLVIYFTS